MGIEIAITQDLNDFVINLQKLLIEVYQEGLKKEESIWAFKLKNH